MIKPEFIGRLKEQLRTDYIRCNPPNHRLPSERKLAELCVTTHGRMHQAILELCQSGEIYTVPRYGIFVSPPPEQTGEQEAVTTPVRNMFQAPHLASLLELTVSAPFGVHSDESQLWQEVFDGFCRDYPFFRLKVDYDITDADTDVQIRSTYVVTPDMAELDPTEFNRNGLLDRLTPGTLRIDMHANRLVGIPLVRTVATLWGNRHRLAEAGLSAADFVRPEDLFINARRVAAIHHDAYQGFIYRAFIYHAAAFGISLDFRDGFFCFDRDRVAEMLQFLKQYLNMQHHIMSFCSQMYDEFFSGRVALLPDYSNLALPADDEFTALGFPVRPGAFGCQNAYVARISSHTRSRLDAGLLIEHMLGDKAQEILCRNHRRFSVRQDIFERQQCSLPIQQEVAFHPEGFTKTEIYHTYGNRFNLEVTKFLCGMQGLEFTLNVLAGPFS